VIVILTKTLQSRSWPTHNIDYKTWVSSTQHGYTDKHSSQYPSSTQHHHIIYTRMVHWSEGSLVWKWVIMWKVLGLVGLSIHCHLLTGN